MINHYKRKNCEIVNGEDVTFCDIGQDCIGDRCLLFMIIFQNMIFNKLYKVIYFFIDIITIGLFNKYFIKSLALFMLLIFNFILTLLTFESILLYSV